ncbi:endonuclease [Caudoviricetes sp.]|nr:endonuclease [Caudoviricetes sp.]
MKTSEQRFWAKVQVTDTCWLWLASTRGAGYGQFWTGERLEDAHRYSYRMHKGAIPQGQVVMHSCDNRLCVNPDHLSLGTQKDNLLDMYAKGRNRAVETYKQQSGDNHWRRKLVLTNG